MRCNDLPILTINETMQKVDGVVQQDFRFHKEFGTKIRLLNIFDYKYGTAGYHIGDIKICTIAYR